MLATSARARVGSSAFSLRKLVLIANGLFLSIVGGSAAVFDLLSYYSAAGPLGTLLYQEHQSVGLFEAHGLALILGILLLRAARVEATATWHLVGVGIHTLLGTSNLMFWPLILVWGVVPQEMVFTSVHWLFALAQLACFLKARHADPNLQKGDTRGLRVFP
jgi:hypothetical protein